MLCRLASRSLSTAIILTQREVQELTTTLIGTCAECGDLFQGHTGSKTEKPKPNTPCGLDSELSYQGKTHQSTKVKGTEQRA